MRFYSLLLTLFLAFSSTVSTTTQIAHNLNFSVIESKSSNNSDSQMPLEIIPLNDHFPSDTKIYAILVLHNNQ